MDHPVGARAYMNMNLVFADRYEYTKALQILKTNSVIGLEVYTIVDNELTLVCKCTG